ncbi:MAG: methionyl-tRNA formyltransferase [Muribaculaceae bacterium]|nr:methionyl-tRNA formyltransferase [Muribaculaceae bacterium]
MDKNKIKIVFFGTPEFAVESLDKLIQSGCDIKAVVTMPDKMAGRGHKIIQSDVKKYALEKKLPLLQPEKLKDPDFLAELKKIDADLFIVIAFRMLPESVWSMPPLGTFNLHASLLPKYRGAAPINWAVINGEKETGVTTFFLKHEIDTGDIIQQKKINIYPSDNVGDVHDKLMHLGAEMVVETVKNIEEGNFSTTPQPEGEYLAAPKIFKETCHIDWSKSAEDIHNLIRGLSPYPAAWTTMTDSRNPEKPLDVKIFQTEIANSLLSNGSPGNIIIDKNRLFVSTGDRVLEILSLQPAGKKRMDAEAFLRGYKPEKFF